MSDVWTVLEPLDGTKMLSERRVQPHPGLLAGRVGSGVAEDETHVFAKLRGRFVFPRRQNAPHRAKVHGSVHYVEIVLSHTHSRVRAGGHRRRERQRKTDRETERDRDR